MELLGKSTTMDQKEKVRAIINQVHVLSQKEKDIIVEEIVTHEYAKGTLLLKQGQVPKKCFMVIEGCVREYAYINGEEKTTAFFTEGDRIAPFTTDTTKEHDQPSRHNLECLEDCVLALSSERDLQPLLSRVPTLDRYIQQVSKEEVAKLKSEWTQFLSASPEERYLKLIQTRPSLFNRVPHHQIASYLGMQPQSLSRIRKRVFDKEMRN